MITADSVQAEPQRRDGVLARLSTGEIRYAALAVLLVAILGAGSRNMDWGGDFWEHSAVVRELATNPFAPAHPQFRIEAPHHFYSPYSLAVGLLARSLALGPVDALAAAGIFNAVLLVFGFRLLVKAFLGDTRPAFWALICALALWGFRPFAWSGFFHLRVLSDVLSYPSTFAVGATGFVCLSYRHYLTGARARYLVTSAAIMIVVALSHPPTALACGILLCALHFCFGRSRPYRLVAGGAVAAVVSAMVLSAWPFFPFWSLFLQGTGAFDETARTLYEEVLWRTFPSLIALPLLVLRLRRNRRDPVVWAFVGLCAAYLAGLATGHWQIGRMMPFLILMLHLAIADWLSGVEQAWRARVIGSAKYGAVMAGFGALLLISADCWNVQTVVQQWLPKERKEYERYAVLSQTVAQYDVVIADMWSSWIAPSFGGKVIAARNPQGFVPDHEQRKNDVKSFFADDTTPDQRAEIVRRYHASFILVNVDRYPLHDEILRQLKAMGTVAHAGNGLILIRISTDRELARRS